MKHRMKWAGAAIAAFVALGMLGTTVPASAGAGDWTTIEITGDAVKDRTFSAFKLATYGPPTIDDGKLKAFDLTTMADLKSKLADYVAENDGDYVDPATQALIDPLSWVAQHWDNDPGNAWTDGTSAAPSVRALANWLASNLANLNLTSADADSVGGVLTVMEGLYLVIDTTTRSDHELTMSLPMIVGTKFMNGNFPLSEFTGGPDGTIDVKGDLVEIDKDIFSAIGTLDADGNSIMDNDDDALSGNEDEDSWTASVGDIVKFIIRTNVPMYTDSHDPEFKIHDAWTDGLTAPIDTDTATSDLNEGLVVTSGGDPLTEVALCTAEPNPPTTDDDQYTYAVVGNTFVITLCDPMAQRGKAIEVAYGAEVTANGADEGDYTWASNTAYVEFTNDWGDNSDSDKNDMTEEDEVDVFTFNSQVVKSDLNDTTQRLKATFTMTNLATGKVHTGTTDTSDAGWTFTGLAGDAWYQVDETDVPIGYTPLNKGVTTFWVYIDANHNEGGTTKGDAAPQWYFFDTAPAKVNDKYPTPTAGSIDSPYVLPTTGIDDDGESDVAVLVLNAKSADDMPSTGGQILLIVGLAGVLGLGGLTFGAVGLRKRKMTAAAVRAA